MSNFSMFKTMEVKEFRDGISKFLNVNQVSKMQFKKFKRYDLVPSLFIEKLETKGIIPMHTRIQTVTELLNLIKTKL